MKYDSATLESLLKEFLEKKALYQEFGEKVESLIKNRLKGTKVKEYISSSRSKDIDSFKKKIIRPDKNYKNPLTDITDLAGIRVNVCYVDEIKIVEKIVDEEFEIDLENSIDKSKLYNPDTFGYLAVHYIISNSKTKKSSSEWSKFNGIKAEIQIRTTLQHSWAVVSHTLYKNENEVPKGLQRRLNRLAGLFELADKEFFEIRQMNERYIQELKTADFENNETDSIEINTYSLKEYIARNRVVITAVKAARDENLLLDDSIQKEYYNKIDSSSVIEICKYFSINTIKELSNLIEAHTKGNEEFIKKIAEINFWKFTKPFIIFLLIMKTKYADFPTDYLIKKYGWEKKIINLLLEEIKKVS
jgi:putative GTP pyrophosphokinase